MDRDELGNVRLIIRWRVVGSRRRLGFPIQGQIGGEELQRTVADTPGRLRQDQFIAPDRRAAVLARGDSIVLGVEGYGVRSRLHRLDVDVQDREGWGIGERDRAAGDQEGGECATPPPRKGGQASHWVLNYSHGGPNT